LDPALTLFPHICEFTLGYKLEKMFQLCTDFFSELNVFIWNSDFITPGYKLTMANIDISNNFVEKVRIVRYKLVIARIQLISCNSDFVTHNSKFFLTILRNCGT